MEEGPPAQRGLTAPARRNTETTWASWPVVRVATSPRSPSLLSPSTATEGQASPQPWLNAPRHAGGEKEGGNTCEGGQQGGQQGGLLHAALAAAVVGRCLVVIPHSRVHGTNWFPQYKL